MGKINNPLSICLIAPLLFVLSCAGREDSERVQADRRAQLLDYLYKKREKVLPCGCTVITYIPVPDVKSIEGSKEIIKEALHSSDTDVRSNALVIGRDLNIEGYEKALIEALDNPNFKLRNTALLVAKEKEWYSLLDVLAARWKNPPAGFRGEELQDTFRFMISAGNTSIPYFISGLSSTDKTVRTYCLQALGEVRAEKEVEKIIPFLRDEDPDMRYAAWYALAKIGTLESFLPLAELFLNDQDPGDIGTLFWPGFIGPRFQDTVRDFDEAIVPYLIGRVREVMPLVRDNTWSNDLKICRYLKLLYLTQKLQALEYLGQYWNLPRELLRQYPFCALIDLKKKELLYEIFRTADRPIKTEAAWAIAIADMEDQAVAAFLKEELAREIDAEADVWSSPGGDVNMLQRYWGPLESHTHIVACLNASERLFPYFESLYRKVADKSPNKIPLLKRLIECVAISSPEEGEDFLASLAFPSDKTGNDQREIQDTALEALYYVPVLRKETKEKLEQLLKNVEAQLKTAKQTDYDLECRRRWLVSILSTRQDKHSSEIAAWQWEQQKFYRQLCAILAFQGGPGLSYSESEDYAYELTRKTFPRETGAENK